MKTRIKGIVPVLITPLTANFELDEVGLKSLCEHVLRNGAGGIWLLGSTGEDLNLPLELRLQVVQKTSEFINGRIPIICGTGCRNVDDALRFIEKSSCASIDAYHFLYLDHKQSSTNLIRQMKKLADESPKPIWLYHNQKRGRTLTKEAVEELREHGNIQGMKAGGSSLAEMIQFMRLQTNEFQVIGATASQFYSMLCLGAEAHTSSEACSRTDSFNDLFRQFQSGNHQKAQDLQNEIIDLNQAIGRTAFYDNGETSAEEKFVCELLGLCREFVNPSYRTLSQEEKDNIKRALSLYNKI